jgi:hypothetical protein
MAVTRTEPVRVEVLRPTGDSARVEAGMRPGWRRTGQIKEITMPMMVSFTPTLTRKLPFAYAFDADVAKAILPVLRIHGVQVEELTRAASITGQRFEVDSVVKLARFENTPRTRTSLRGRWTDATARIGGPSSPTYVVRAGQQLGLLAMYLLEPESDDGLMSWGFLDALREESGS